jgi:hypothetical protein
MGSSLAMLFTAAVVQARIGGGGWRWLRHHRDAS